MSFQTARNEEYSSDDDALFECIDQIDQGNNAASDNVNTNNSEVQSDGVTTLPESFKVWSEANDYLIEHIPSPIIPSVYDYLHDPLKGMMKFSETVNELQEERHRIGDMHDQELETKQAIINQKTEEIRVKDEAISALEIVLDVKQAAINAKTDELRDKDELIDIIETELERARFFREEDAAVAQYEINELKEQLEYKEAHIESIYTSLDRVCEHSERQQSKIEALEMDLNQKTREAQQAIKIMVDLKQAWDDKERSYLDAVAKKEREIEALKMSAEMTCENTMNTNDPKTDENYEKRKNSGAQAMVHALFMNILNCAAFALFRTMQLKSESDYLAFLIVMTFMKLCSGSLNAIGANNLFRTYALVLVLNVCWIFVDSWMADVSFLIVQSIMLAVCVALKSEEFVEYFCLEKTLIFSLDKDADGLLGFASSPSFVVTAVHPGCGAEMRGLKAGDRIVSVDGRRVAGASWDAVQNNIARAEAPVIMVVKRKIWA